MTEHKAHLTYGNISIIDPARRIIAVPDGTLVQFKGTGVYVNSSRDDVDGQAHVTINTEDTPARDRATDGQPILEVSLNDATLYDREHDPAPELTAEHLRDAATIIEANEGGATYPAALARTLREVAKAMEG